MFIPVGEWTPDQPDFQNPGSKTITNVAPLTARSYGPWKALAASGSTLAAACQGAIGFRGSVTSGQTFNFYSNATKLYQENGGVVVDVTGGVAWAGGNFWSAAGFGKRLVVLDRAGTNATFLTESDVVFSNIAAMPAALYCATVRDFLMLGYVKSAGVFLPSRVHWSAIGDPTSWPTAGTDAAIAVQSDYQDLQETDLGPVVGVVGGLAGADGAVICERGIWRVSYVGPAPFFRFDVASRGVGCIAPASIVPGKLGERDVVYFLGTDGFYAFDGQTLIPIGHDKVNRTFLADFVSGTSGISYAIQAAADPVNPYILFAYKNASAVSYFNRLMVFNHQLGRWSLIDLTGGEIEYLFQFYTWATATPSLRAFNSSHAMASFSGSNLAPTVETSEAQLFPGGVDDKTGAVTRGRRGLITSARAQVDGGTPSVSVGTRDRLQDSVTYQTAVATNAIGECPQRVTGRYARARITLPAASTFTHIEGVDVTARPEATLR